MLNGLDPPPHYGPHPALRSRIVEGLSDPLWDACPSCRKVPTPRSILFFPSILQKVTPCGGSMILDIQGYDEHVDSFDLRMPDRTKNQTCSQVRPAVESDGRWM
jgi:hypothetical protein